MIVYIYISYLDGFENQETTLVIKVLGCFWFALCHPAVGVATEIAMGCQLSCRYGGTPIAGWFLGKTHIYRNG